MTNIYNRLNDIIDELVDSGITLEQALEVFEEKYIATAMAVQDGNVTRASRILGIHRNTLHNKLRISSRIDGFVATLRKNKRAARKSAAKKTTARRTPRKTTRR